jgi:hypothetical protein
LDVDQILAQHVRILKDVEAFEIATQAPRPEQFEVLAHRRWAFASDLLLHCSWMESSVLAPLRVDARPEAARRARAASAATAEFIKLFHHHVEHWRDSPPGERWDEYRQAAAALVRAIRELMDREAREIVPLLPVQPSGTPPVARDHYASDAWELRGTFFADERRP